MGEGKPNQSLVETLEVDGRHFDVYELRTGDEIDGYDVYECLGEEDQSSSINVGDMFDERPTIESVRNYLRENNL